MEQYESKTNAQSTHEPWAFADGYRNLHFPRPEGSSKCKRHSRRVENEKAATISLPPKPAKQGHRKLHQRAPHTLLRGTHRKSYGLTSKSQLGRSTTHGRKQAKNPILLANNDKGKHTPPRISSSTYINKVRGVHKWFLMVFIVYLGFAGIFGLCICL